MAEFLERRRLPDDVVEYLLIPKLPDDLDETDTIGFLEKTCDSYLGKVGPLVIDYVWQKESFSLKPVACGADVPPHLYGRTNFGDNIDDEWFIVYLLYELSKQFPDLVIKVTDNDEEFLLIEAADHLPKWLNPETAENRVYISNGVLHVIPMPESPSDVNSFPLFTPSVEEAVGLVRNNNLNTQASQAIQDALRKRIDSFPAKIQENSHFANVYVPVNVAAILAERPSLISAAVQAFYYRDPVELKVCRTMNHFKPENMVVTRVRFTQCLYAQLVQQKFQPDKRSGWVLPSTSNPKFKEQDLGMKLAHGFEIVCARCKSSPSQTTTNGDTTSDVRWSRFLRSITNNGYFKGELEGSKLYQKLLNDAKKFFQSQVTPSEEDDSSVAREVLQLLSSVSDDVGPWKKQEKSLPPSDDDSWLELTPDSLEEMLRAAAGKGTSPDAMDLKKVADSMNAFVEKVSSVDGVEFPSSKKSPSKNKDEGEGDVEFDGTSFIHAMQKMFDFKDDEGSSSDMSEYDWEEDSDDDLGSPTKPPSTRPAVPARRPRAAPPKPPSRRQDPEIKAIMQAMDRELARTDIGKSFETEPPRPTPRTFQPPKRQNGKASKSSTGSSSTQRPTRPPPPRPPPPKPGQATPKPSAAKSKMADKDIDDEDDDFRPVNIDLNTVKNTLESFRAQQGLSGPASNILQSMGVGLPQDEDEDPMQ
ncbi:hypothetical protein BaRGS_00039373 [Batillaria attramentaria]|uniref:Uncharacterized protein n=1 Tax=Batillaria attramentaria TaxID=370345 RepID=A0ABD0J3J5_9CAEN